MAEVDGTDIDDVEKFPADLTMQEVATVMNGDRFSCKAEKICLTLPGFVGERLLLSSGSPVCGYAESRFELAQEREKLVEETDVELIYFLTTGRVVRQVRQNVARVFLKLDRSLGVKNGFVYDSESWLNGFVFNRFSGKSYVGRPLMRTCSNFGFELLKAAFPGVDPGIMPGGVFKKVEWDAVKWLHATGRV